MNEQEALSRMIAPGTRRKGKYREGVIQIHVTRSCDKACFGCTQGSNLRGKATFITLENFEKAVISLKGYFGVVGVFGGNPALHPRFEELCSILSKHIPFEQRGLWCNHPAGKGRVMSETFNPAVSNLNVHLDQQAWDEFKRDWPSSQPFGLTQDSRHSPPYVAMKDVLKKECEYCMGKGQIRVITPHTPIPIIVRGDDKTDSGRLEECEYCNGAGQVYDEEKAWELISNCDINQHWSAMMGQFRGELRAWFCEIAGAQSILHQDDPDYPDTGLRVVCPMCNRIAGIQGRDCPQCGPGRENEKPWWQLPMDMFRRQVKKHCHDCGVPLRGYGELAQAVDPMDFSGVWTPMEQVSKTHEKIYQPKRPGRAVELVTTTDQLQCGRIEKTTHYLQNAKR